MTRFLGLLSFSRVFCHTCLCARSSLHLTIMVYIRFCPMEVTFETDMNMFFFVTLLTEVPPYMLVVLGRK